MDSWPEMTDEIKLIERFFDETSRHREDRVENDPWLHYEQMWRQKTVLDLIHPAPGRTLADVGAGTLRDSVVLQHMGFRVMSLDLSDKMLRQGIERHGGEHPPPCMQASAAVLPLPAASVDCIVCSEVIEHVPGYGRALKEFHRCLKPGGVLVLTTPNWRSLYGLNRKIVEVVQGLAGKKPWGGHPFDEWKQPAEVKTCVESIGFSIERWIGICYLPGFTMKQILPNGAKRLAIGAIGRIEGRLRQIAPRWGYGIGIRARKR